MTHIHLAYTKCVSAWLIRSNSGGASCDRGLNLYQPLKGLNINQIGHTQHIHQMLKCLKDITHIVVAQAAIEE